MKSSVASVVMVSVTRVYNKFFRGRAANPAHNLRRAWLTGGRGFPTFGCLTDGTLSLFGRGGTNSHHSPLRRSL